MGGHIFYNGYNDISIYYSKNQEYNHLLLSFKKTDSLFWITYDVIVNSQWLDTKLENLVIR